MEKLENKLKNSPTNSSELQIYKQSAIQATKATDDSEKNSVKLEKEKIKYNELNKKFESKKGYEFVRKNDLIQHHENLKKKKNYIINVKKL